MSVKHSLLALLSERPRYGYELKSEFETRTGGTWPLNIGQVYSTLDRAERDGLVVKTEPDAEGRVTYVVTDAGRAEAATWFATPLEVAAPPRHELAIKLALALSLPDVDVVGLIAGQRTATMHTLQTWTRAKRDADPDDLAWLLNVELMILNAEAEARWLDHCESLAVRASARVVRSVEGAPAGSAIVSKAVSR